MIISNVVPLEQLDVEQGDAARQAYQTSCCPWTRKTWRRIIIGSTALTDAGAIAMLIYGAVTSNGLIFNIGATSSVVSSSAGLFAYVLINEC